MSNSINKVIEQVAYKQVEDMIVYLEMLDEQFLKTSKTARETSKSFSMPSGNNSDLNKKLLDSQKVIIQLQKDYNNNREALDKLTKKLEGYSNAQRNTTKANYDNSISQSILLKNAKEEEVKTSTLTTYIQKLSVERIQAGRIVADYNAKIALGNNLTEEETQKLAQATAQFQKYDNAIKAGKTSIGDAREYVGQYERANVGLSNSIGQIARELPSATFGFQTFALGISNNIPIAVDEIKKAVEINKELIEQGKPVTSIWKQVGSALFSFNTLMSVGLLLLALYGKEIGNFFKEMTGGASKINAVVESQKLLNEATIEGTKAVKDESVELKSNLAIARDNNLTKKERLIAVDKIIKQYPFYFEGLTKEEILAGKTEKAERKLTEALLARAKSTAAMNKIQSEQSKIIDIEENLYQLQRKLADAETKNADAVKNVIKVNRSRGDAEAFQAVQTAGNVEEIKRKIKAQENEKKALTEVVERITGYVIENDKASIGLDYQTDSTNENTKAIKLNTKAREDYLASEYELWKLRKTNQSNLNKDIMEDEASSYDLRLLASEQYHDGMIELAQREAQEQQRVLKYTLDQRNDTLDTERLNEIAQLNAQLKNQQISQSDYYVKLKDIDDNYYYDKNGIQKNYENESLMISENYTQSYLNIQKEMIGKMIELYDTINFQKAEVEIAQVDLKGVEKLKEILGSIGSDMSIEEIKGKLDEVNTIANDNAIDLSKRNAQRELEEKQARANRVIDEIALLGVLNGLSDEEIANQVYSNQELLELDKEIIESKKKVTEAENEEVKKRIQNEILFLEKKRELNQELKDMQIQLVQELGELANQLFSNQIDKYDREIEKSNDYYDSLLENAENGSIQEQVIQEEKARKEEELQRKKIALQRKQAIFNKAMAVAEIAVELAKTIGKINMEAAVLLANPLTAALAPLALSQIPYAVATSAIQIGAVLATPLPQYKDGTDFHKGGKAVLGDGYVNEVVENPDGSIFVTPNKPTILDLPKGAKVHSSLDEFNKNKLNLESASIMASFVNQSNQLKAFDYYLGKELNGLSNKIEKGIEKGFKKAKINNNNVNNVYLPSKPTNFFN